MSANEAFTIDSTDFDAATAALAEDFPKAAAVGVQGALRAMGNAVRRNVRKAAKPHRRTGSLYKHVQMKFTGKGINSTAKVYSGGSAAVLVSHGVTRHLIAAQKGHALNLSRATQGVKLGEVSGWASHVEHPGFPGDPYFHRGVKASTTEINVILAHTAQNMADVLAEQLDGGAA